MRLRAHVRHHARTMPEAISVSTPIALGLVITMLVFAGSLGALFWRAGRNERDLDVMRVAIEHSRSEANGLQTSMARLEAKVDVLLGQKSNV